MLVLEAADQLDRLGNKKARGTIAMAKVMVVSNMKCQNHLVHFYFDNDQVLCYNVNEFYFKMPWPYVEQVAAPNMALKVLDMAIQVHGAAGVSSDTVLAHLWATARTLRIADGPDEVHLGTIARLELQRAKL